MLKRASHLIGGFLAALVIIFTTAQYGGFASFYGGNAPGICFGGMCLSAYAGSPDGNVTGNGPGHWCFDTTTGNAYEYNGTAGGNTPWAVISSGGGGGGIGDITSVWTTLTSAVTNLVAGAGDTFDAGAADSSKPCKRGTTLPGTCSEGECFQDTDSGGSETYFCVASNSWVKLVSANDDDDVPEVGDFGAFNPSACPSNQWVTDITSGALVCAQPAFSNLSGTATDGQIPSGVTRDTEWDSISEIQAALTDGHLVKGPSVSVDGGIATYSGTGGNEVKQSDCYIVSGELFCSNKNTASQPNSEGFFENCGVSATCASACSGTYGYCFVDFDPTCNSIDLHVCFGGTDLSGGSIPDSGNTTAARSKVFRGNKNAGGRWAVDHFDVTDCGARGDGTTDDTQAIRDCIWDACQSTGPAEVYFPGTANYYKITERLPVYSESTRSFPWPTAGTSTSTIVSGCNGVGNPLPCCQGKGIGFCGVEPYKCDNVTFRGESKKRSRIVQMFTETTTGDRDTRPVFDIRAAKNITFRDLSLENGTTKATYGSGSSKDAIAGTVLAREYRAGLFLIDGTDNLLVDNVRFYNFVNAVRQRGYTDNVSITRNNTFRNVEISKDTYGLQGFDNIDTVRIEGYKISIEDSESNAEHGIYISPDYGRVTNAQIADVYCGDWDGLGLTSIGTDCLSLRHIDGLNVVNTIAYDMGIASFQDIRGGTVTGLISRGTKAGCFGLSGGSVDLDISQFECNLGDVIHANPDCSGLNTPLACCDADNSGPTCFDGPVIDLNATDPSSNTTKSYNHVKRCKIHDGTIRANAFSSAYGVINVTSGTGTFDGNKIYNIDVINTYTGGAVSWPVIKVENPGIDNYAGYIRQFPKNNSNWLIRFIQTTGTEWFIDFPQWPGNDDSTLASTAVLKKGSREYCHNCAVTAGTGVCTTGGNNTNVLAEFDGQDWICGKSYSSIKYVTHDFVAGGLTNDGTICSVPAKQAINGRNKTVFTCSNNTSGTMEGSFILPGTATGGAVNFKIIGYDTNATPTGVWGVNFSCQCRRPGTATGGTMSGVQSANITLDSTQYAPSMGSRTAHTCNGSCQAGDELNWLAQINTGYTTTDTVYIGHVLVEFPVWKHGSDAVVPTPTATASVTQTPTPTLTPNGSTTPTPTPTATPQETPATPLPTP